MGTFDLEDTVSECEKLNHNLTKIREYISNRNCFCLYYCEDCKTTKRGLVDYEKIMDFQDSLRKPFTI